MVWFMLFLLLRGFRLFSLEPNGNEKFNELAYFQTLCIFMEEGDETEGREGEVDEMKEEG